MSEATLSNQAVYEAFATYLMREYKQPGNADQFLTASTAVAYLRAIINRSSARFKAVGTDSSKLFFTCLESNASTASADWLKGLTKNMLREGFERVKAAGAQHDNSQTPVYKEHILAANKAYALEGSMEASVRRFSISCLRMTAGRSAEPAFMTYTSLRWDPCFVCTIDAVDAIEEN